MVGIFHPVGSELNIAKAEASSSLSAFGIPLQNGGKAGFSREVSWAA
jgi:hypothetical protein